MIEQADLASAAADAVKLCGAIAGFGDLMALNIDRYWKINGYFEAALSLQVDQPGETLPSVADALAPDWEWGSDSDWAVWDRKSHGTFKVQSLVASVRWAHVELLPDRPDREVGPISSVTGSDYALSAPKPTVPKS